MRSEHLSDDEVVAFCDDPASVAGAATHIADCQHCTPRVEYQRRLLASDDRDYALAEGLAGELSELLDFGDRLATEDIEAERLLAPVTESPKLFSKSNILRRPQFFTGGVIRKLCKLAAEWCYKNPTYALQLADVAKTIGEALPDDYYPGNMLSAYRGDAYKEFSTASRYASKFKQALAELDRAEHEYRRLADPEGRIVAVDLARAIIFIWQKQYSEALRVARKAASESLRRGGETIQYFEARQVEAMALHRLGDVASACEIYRQTYNIADDLGDVEMKARAAKNLGIALRDRGNLNEASIYFLEALQIFSCLGKEITVLRMRLSISALTLAAGHLRDAEIQFRTLVSEFDSRGMPDEAREADLYLAEALLGQHGDVPEIRSICHRVFDYYHRQDIVTGALAAATFLRDTADTHKLRFHQLGHVRRFLADVKENPTLLFAPPTDISAKE